MHSATSDALQDDGFLFQLYLPDGDDVSVFDRADALAGWVNHFLLGLGVTQPKLDKVTGETGEAIDDLRNIAQLGYDEDEDQEELEMSLEEILRIRSCCRAVMPRHLYSSATDRARSTKTDSTLKTKKRKESVMSEISRQEFSVAVRPWWSKCNPAAPR